MARHTFTRAELHNLVWSEPMTRIAARYGISGRGLAKACERAAIPVPERGYWARVRAGHKIARKPLPDPKPDIPERITISPDGPRRERPRPPAPPATVQAKIDAELTTEKRLVVPASLSKPHRIVAAWLEE